MCCKKALDGITVLFTFSKIFINHPGQFTRTTGTLYPTAIISGGFFFTIDIELFNMI